MGRRKEPEARYCEDYGIVVHRTHDLAIATGLALDLTRELRGYLPTDVLPEWEEIRLSAGVPTWLRTRPARPEEQDAYCIRYWYHPPRQAEERGAFRAVEFPDNGNVMGLRIDRAP